MLSCQCSSLNTNVSSTIIFTIFITIVDIVIVIGVTLFLYKFIIYIISINAYYNMPITHCENFYILQTPLIDI